MADSIRISDLTYIDDRQLSLEDQLIINDLSSNTDAVTRITEIASFIEFFTSQDLHFSGDVTFTGSLKPPPGQELDVVFNNVTLKGDLILEPTVAVKGLELNKHLDDVSINPASLVLDNVLAWDPDEYDKNGFKGAWVNKTVTISDGQYVEEAPLTGGPYLRKSAQWVEDDGEFVEEAPLTGGPYLRQEAKWVTDDGEYLEDAPLTGGPYQRQAGLWVEDDDKDYLTDPPYDGEKYFRSMGDWVAYEPAEEYPEAPKDGGYYVRRYANGVHFWEDIRPYLFANTNYIKMDPDIETP